VGVTDSEIKIGNLMPYSGPASAYAAIGMASTTNAAGVDASRDIISAVYLRD
jgi:branched-chain amino acid transport system substrate-binding protein